MPEVGDALGYGQLVLDDEQLAVADYTADDGDDA